MTTHPMSSLVSKQDVALIWMDGHVRCETGDSEISDTQVTGEVRDQAGARKENRRMLNKLHPKTVNSRRQCECADHE